MFSFSVITYKNARIIYTPDTSFQGRCGYHPGLFACRCDPQCEHFQDCCFDYADVCSSPSKNVNETGIFDSALYTCTAIDRDYPQFGSVILVNKCPNNNIDGQIKQSCENLPSIYSDPGERFVVEWPVSNQHGENFRNLFCALCNGQNFFDVVPWNTTFPPFTPASIGQEESHCNQPSHRVGKRLRYCFPSLISSCPLSPDINASYHEYCKSFSNPVCFGEGGRPIMYNNYYCALCNGYNINTLGLCEYGPLHSEHSHVVFKGIWSFKEHSPEMSEFVNLCVDDKGTVYDPYTNQCRPLSCPPGYMLNNKSECINAPAQSHHIDGLCCHGQMASIFLLYDGPYDRYPLKYDNDVLTFLQQIRSSVHGADVKWKKSQYLSAFYTKFLLQSDSVCNVAVAVEDIVHNMSKEVVNTHGLGLRCIDYMFMCSNFPSDYNCVDNWFRGKANEFIPDTFSHITEVFFHKGQYIIPKLTIHSVSYKTYNYMKREFVKEETVQVCGDSFYPLHCQLVTLEIDEYSVSYTINGSRLIHYGNISYEQGDYIMFPKGQVQICAENFALRKITFFAYADTMAIVNTIGITMSLLGLIVTFGLRCCSSGRINFHDRCILILCIFLFIAQLLPILSVYCSFPKGVCIISALVSHYCWLGSFSCMSVVAYDLFHIFCCGAFQNIRDWESGRFCRYVAPAVDFGLPFIIVAISLCLHVLHPTFEYGATVPCWISDFGCNLWAFGFPVGVLLGFNAVLFTVTLISACRSQRRSRQLRNEETDAWAVIRDLILCFKVSGFTDC